MTPATTHRDETPDSTTPCPNCEAFALHYTQNGVVRGTRGERINEYHECAECGCRVDMFGRWAMVPR